MYITNQIKIPNIPSREVSKSPFLSRVLSFFLPWIDAKEGPHRHWPETQHLDVTWGPERTMKRAGQRNYGKIHHAVNG